jgi:hypothetical protein
MKGAINTSPPLKTPTPKPVTIWKPYCVEATLKDVEVFEIPTVPMISKTPPIINIITGGTFVFPINVAASVAAKGTKSEKGINRVPATNAEFPFTV